MRSGAPSSLQFVGCGITHGMARVAPIGPGRARDWTRQFHNRTHGSLGDHTSLFGLCSADITDDLRVGAGSDGVAAWSTTSETCTESSPSHRDDSSNEHCPRLRSTLRVVVIESGVHAAGLRTLRTTPKIARRAAVAVASRLPRPSLMSVTMELLSCVQARRKARTAKTRRCWSGETSS